MSKYTAEQVRDWHRAKAECVRNGMSTGNATVHDRMADAIDALLREREAAKAGVTDEIVYRACKAGRITRDEPPEHELAAMRRKLEAVAPMLASARVPDAMVLVPRTDVEKLLKLTTFNTSSLAATFSEWAEKMLAAAPKPEVSERHHWLCCGALKPDHSDKPRVMPDCFDPERHVWAVSPKPETEE